LTATGKKESVSTPPPDPGVRSSSDGPTRRRCLCPVARRRCRLHRTRASGEKRGCLGASWEWGEFVRGLGGGFYRLGSRGRGRPVARRCGGPSDVQRATPGAAALLACWRGLVAVTGCCGSVLARSRRSATCREQRKKRGGPGRILPLLLPFSRLGSGQRGLGSTAEDSSSMATGPRRTGTVMLTVAPIFWIFASQVFDQMPARI
jgi:hypothetical protein